MQITTDVSGDFQITDDDYPGLFNEHAGAFTMWISSEEDGAPRVTLTIDEVEYNCINLTITCE